MNRTTPNRAGQPRRPSYWETISDEELLLKDTTIDPEAIVGLLDRAPETEEVPRIAGDYDTSLTSGRMMRCARCKATAANHYRGFVMEFDDGRRMLIGRDCGERHYQAEFKHDHNAFLGAVKRKELLQRREVLIVARSTLRSVLESIEIHPSWKAYGTLRREFNAAFADLMHDLTEAAGKRDGALFVQIQVRDHEAERAAAEKSGRKQKPKYRWVDHLAHTLAGRGFLEQRYAPDKVVPGLVGRLKAGLLRVDEVEAGHTRDLEHYLRSMVGLVRELRGEADRFKALEPFFDASNIDGITSWLKAQKTGSYLFLDGERLYRSSWRGGAVLTFTTSEWGTPRRSEMRVPRPLPEPPLDLIEQASRLLGGEVAE